MRQRQPILAPLDCGPTARQRRGGARRVLAILGLVSAAVIATSGSAVAAINDPEGLQVTYPDGELNLENLAPGRVVQAQAQVTNHHDTEVTVDLASDWPNPPLDIDGVELAAQVCTTRWDDGVCSGESQNVDLTVEPTVVGTLGAGESWHVLMSASMAVDAVNDTQNLSAPFTLHLFAQADASDDGPPPPTDGELPTTGASTWPLVGLATALLAVGAFVTGLLRVRRNRVGAR